MRARGSISHGERASRCLNGNQRPTRKIDLADQVGLGVRPRGPDTNGAVFRSNTLVANQDVVIAGRAVPRTVSEGAVGVAGGVAGAERDGGAGDEIGGEGALVGQ